MAVERINKLTTRHEGHAPEMTTAPAQASVHL
jgi:hypothetical protein